MLSRPARGGGVLQLVRRTPRFPADVRDEALAEMEKELFARTSVEPEALTGLMQQRALSVQRALLKTEKVPAERLFILAPPAAGSASNGQSCVNLSLN